MALKISLELLRRPKVQVLGARRADRGHD